MSYLTRQKGAGRGDPLKALRWEIVTDRLGGPSVTPWVLIKGRQVRVRDVHKEKPGAVVN